MLATCSGDKTARIWQQTNPGQWTTVAELDDIHQRTVRGVAFSPSGRMLATASFDSQVAVWTKEGNEWTCMTQLEGHENEVKSVAWSANGTLLATCSRDKSVWIWECTRAGLVFNLHAKLVSVDGDDFECVSVLQEHTQDVKFVTWHPTEDVRTNILSAFTDAPCQLLVSCSYDDTIKIWRADMDDWFCADTLTGHTSTVWCAAFSPDGNQLGTWRECFSVR